MRKVFFLLFTLFFLITFCAKRVDKEKKISFFSKIRVIKQSGISLRKEPSSKSEKIGSVYYNYVYPVIDFYPSYYKIVLPDGKTKGWIYAGYDEKWTSVLKNNKVQILRKNGITIRKSPYNKSSERIGVAPYKAEIDILDTEYSWIKVITPDGKKGWIYVGKPEDRWIEFLD